MSKYDRPFEWNTGLEKPIGLNGFIPSWARGVSLGPSGGAMVSVEKVVITFTSGEVDKTVNLTKGQNPNQCIVFESKRFDTREFDDGINKFAFSTDVIDNAGTPAVRVRRRSDVPGGGFVVSVYVVEFNADIAIQQLTHDSGVAASWTKACTPVDRNHAFLLNTMRVKTGQTEDNNDDQFVKATFNSDAEIQFTRSAGGTLGLDGTVYVVEDTTKGGHFTVQTFSGTHSANGNYDKVLGAAVDPAKTMVLATATSDGLHDHVHQAAHTVRLLDANTVRINIDGNNTYARDIHGFVIEWFDGTFVQRGNFGLTTGTSDAARNHDVALTTIVDPAESIAYTTQRNIAGKTTLPNNDDTYGHMITMPKVEVYNSGTEIRFQWREAHAQSVMNIDASWEVVRFMPEGALSFGAVTVFSDTFTDTNGTLLTAHSPDIGGGSYSVLTGSSPDIQSNELTLDASQETSYDVGESDGTFSLTLRRANDFGVVFRGAADPTQDSLMVWVQQSGFTLYQRLAGSWTVIGSATGLDNTVNSVYDIILDGDSVKIDVDGVNKVDITETDHQTATKIGFYGSNTGVIDSMSWSA